MPNIKSAIKRVKVTKVKSLKNSMRKSALKTTLKKVQEAIDKKDTSSTVLLKNAISALDKAVAKNILHKNTAARKKSSLVKALNAVNK